MKRKTIIGLAALAVFVSIAVIYPLIRIINNFGNSAMMYAPMNRHYIMITDGEDKDFWNRVYESAAEVGREQGVYVELLGPGLSVDYERNELLEMARYAQADGVIVQASDDEETLALIDEIVEQGTPVVTVLNDCNGSARQCYVGVNSYDIGQLYGSQICELIRGKYKSKARVLVTKSADAFRTSDNLILLGIRERLEQELADYDVQVDVQPIAQSSNYASEEYFNALYLEKSLPDVLVCLDALGTICAYQAAIDHNQVGSVDILGFYDSDSILVEVEKRVLESTLSVNAEQMGRMCIEALEDYITTGYTNSYMAVDIAMIRQWDAFQRINGRGN